MFEIFISRRATIALIKDYLHDIEVEGEDWIIEDLESLIRELPYHWDESIEAQIVKYLTGAGTLMVKPCRKIAKMSIWHFSQRKITFFVQFATSQNQHFTALKRYHFSTLKRHRVSAQKLSARAVPPFSICDLGAYTSHLYAPPHRTLVIYHFNTLKR